MLSLKRLTLLLTLAAFSMVANGAMAQTLTVASPNLQSGARHLDPGADHSNVGSQLYYNTFDTLIEKDHTTTKHVYRPGLATSWRLITPRLMELKIRQGVKFHNGETMTVDDVIYTFQRVWSSKYPFYITRNNEYFTNMQRIERVDDETIRIYTKNNEPIFELLMNVQQGMVIPKKYLMGLTGHPEIDEFTDYEEFSRRPIGTGPYKIAKIVPDDRIIYERFDDFWGEKAPFERVILRRIPELAARMAALKNGEVDLITNLPPDQIQVIASDPNLKVESMVTPLFHVMFYNTVNPSMADKRLRQALSYAIDRKTLNDALWLGRAVVPSTHTYPQYGDMYMPELKTWEYNPDKAKQLLKEAGYDGSTIRYDTFSVYYTNGVLAAQAIMEMWAKVGVKGKINVTDKWTGGDADMQARNWSNPMYFADPSGSYGTMWSPVGARVTAGTWKPNKEYTAMWDKFRYETDTEKRRAAYAVIMEYAKDEAPFLVLYQPYESYGMRKGVNWKPFPGHIPYVLDFRAGSVSMSK